MKLFLEACSIIYLIESQQEQDRQAQNQKGQTRLINNY